MRTALIACVLVLSGCSLAVRPNPRDLFTDAGPTMGDAGPNAPDAWIDPNDVGADGGQTGSCADHAVGSVAPVVTNDCGFYATQYDVTYLNCIGHAITGRLTISCGHTYQTIPIGQDPVVFPCDGGSFTCSSALTADGVLSISCTSPSGSSCSIGF